MPDIRPGAAIAPEHMTELEQCGRRMAHGLNRHVCVGIGPFAGREESFLTKSTLTAANREGDNRYATLHCPGPHSHAASPLATNWAAFD
jgi:hypothetical protein